jgi:hypothetical protein
MRQNLLARIARRECDLSKPVEYVEVHLVALRPDRTQGETFRVLKFP